VENGFAGWQVMLAWMAILAPVILFDIAALKWGVVTSGDRGGKTCIEV
jgi:hypothetical protein